LAGRNRVDVAVFQRGGVVEPGALLLRVGQAPPAALSTQSGGLERARNYFTHLGYRGFFVHDGHIKPIERFSIDRMQHPANLPDLTAPLQARQRFGRYIYNFIFLPAQEPEMTVWKMSERLHKLAAH